MPFTTLDPRIQKAIKLAGYTTPTPIQIQALPLAFEGHDLLASAQTGTGKTAAFVLPLLQRLLGAVSQSSGQGPRALILTPTRELAMQIAETIQNLKQFTALKAGVIVGGVKYAAQEKLLRNPLDILVATPGRLMDHVRRGQLKCSRIEVLVLDEADRMLDMGFIEEVETIIRLIPKGYQSLLFSATITKNVNEIALKLQHNPVRIEVSPRKEHNPNIKQKAYKADNLGHKQALLHQLLSEQELTKAIIFVETKKATEALAKFLTNKGYSSLALHGDMNQSARTHIIKQLHLSKLKVLVATNVAARGLDVKGISHVINFDMPTAVEDYVHRIGRTGRCECEGIAISLVDRQDLSKFARIKQAMGQTIEVKTIKGLEPSSHPVDKSRNPAFKKKAPLSAGKKGRRSDKSHFPPARQRKAKGKIRASQQNLL